MKSIDQQSKRSRQVVRAIRHWLVTWRPTEEAGLPNTRDLIVYFERFREDAAKFRGKVLDPAEETFTDLAMSAYG